MSNLEQLTNVNFSGTFCGSEGALLLSTSPFMKNLVALNLEGNSIGMDGVKLIGECAEFFEYLTELNLNSNGLYNEGWKELLLLWSSHVEKRNACQRSKLRKLCLRNNELEDEGMEEVFENVPRGWFDQATELDLSQNKIGPVTLQFIASRFGQLQTLIVSGNTSIEEEGMKHLAMSKVMHHLTFLDLSYTNIGLRALNHLTASPNFQHLTYLNLTKCSIGDEGVKLVCCSDFLKKLTTLKLGSTVVLNEAVTHLSNSQNMSTLTDLDLSFNFINSVGMEILSKTLFLQNLTCLNLAENTLIGFEGISQLATSEQFQNLQQLNLSNTNLDPQGMEILCTNLHHFPKLTSLNISNNALGNEGAQALLSSQFSPFIQNLTELDMTQCQIGMKHIQEISKKFSKLLKQNFSFSFVLEWQ
ncbi:hypothetical protein C9374_013180 [Naegleria lovaniensis]|uniref:Uncharacterized protein n=1 Tax=Naegleria lovaniensis TaxID=51637 RepID=A0AA88KE03_NAELO|nr:uncharacterized protein C9374_013180 [Naegleria lovaniensis]KAG2372816.1 hypothetical protein C9374_013180 [Naegleria lovaniensis]